MAVGVLSLTANKPGYPVLDNFRVVAAFMVIAVHTSPLWSVNETADFIFTRVFCRVAVPFFFMATGFFLNHSNRSGALLHSSAKIARLYALSVLIYLPLNIYAGYFTQSGLFPKLAFDLLWNGTFYHLWYFSAVLLGSVIAYLLYKHVPAKVGIAIAAALYIVGLGGDSYYGVVSHTPVLKNIYDCLFTVFEYTRNGLFFAPLFILLGMQASKSVTKPRHKTFYVSGFCISFLLMLAEALGLYTAGGMRHDSMYLLLPICMWFLFRLLAAKQGITKPAKRSFSLWLYILHPWCIVLVRGTAKVLKIDGFILNNSPIFYLAVCAASTLLALFILWLTSLRHKNHTPPTQRSWAELDEQALLHNTHEIQGLLPNQCQLMAVVKANAYGHGATWVARSLQRNRVNAFAVATMEEGVQLRKKGIKGTILVLGYTPPEYAKRLRFYRLTQTVADVQHARQLAAQRVPLQVHIKVDTGMHRLGVDTENINGLFDVYSMPFLKVTGTYTHLSRADSHLPKDEAFTDKQISRFYNLLEMLANQGMETGKIHLQSSYGLLNRPGLPCDYARIGIALYGAVDCISENTRAIANLRPVLSVKAHVASVREVNAGEWVGYGSAHLCKQKTKVATLTVGYADGIHRSLYNGRVLLHGKPAAVIGRISMDQMAVCVNDIPEVAAGDIATIIGTDGKEKITVLELAQKCGTLPNEIFTGIGSRVQRVVVPQGMLQAETARHNANPPYPAAFSFAQASYMVNRKQI